jgi:hypothetical protein
MNTNVGVLTDQPIAWAWCNSANTTVVVFDIRLKAVKSLPPVVATTAERDAKFMSPTQGLQVWRDDLGAIETYYGLYNSSTNPGGRDTAGWYVSNRSAGFVPIKPTTVTAVSGTATTNAMGVVTFSGVTSINLTGVFSSAYNNYQLMFSQLDATNTANFLAFRMSSSGTDSTASYSRMGTKAISNASNAAINAESQAHLNLGELAYTGKFASTLSVFNPFLATNTVFTFNSTTVQNGGAQINSVGGGSHSVATSYNGFTLIASAGNISGKVSVIGWNE